MPELGDRFRTTREARGLSLSDVAEQIRIRSVYLEAIELEDWNAIGPPVYIRGFLRTYARFLGLDAEDVVSEFNRVAPPGKRTLVAQVVIEPPKESERSLWPVLIWVASGVAVLLIAFVVFNEISLHERSASGVVAAASAGPSLSPSPLVSPTPTSSPTPSGHALILQLTGLCWLRVVVDGSVSMEGTFRAGFSRTFAGKRVEVLAGNAGAVNLTVDGVNLGKMGGLGKVVQRTFTV